MQRLIALFTILSISGISGPAFAGGADATTVKLTGETVATSNILDDATRLADVGLRLRGLLGETVATDLGDLRVDTGIDILHYRKYRFADQRAFHLGVSQTSVATGPFSYKTHVGYDMTDQGDDINVAGLLLALRQASQSFSAGGTATLKLPDDFAFAAALDDRYQRVGKARFVADLPDTRVNPDSNTVDASLGLAKTDGSMQYGLIAQFSDVALFRQTAVQNAVAYRSYALRGRLAAGNVGGWKLTGEFGLRHLADARDLYDKIRPVYALAAERKFAGRYELKGRFTTDFETGDTDDPLATYQHRIELEANARLIEHVVFGTGVFAEYGDNLLLLSRRRKWGAYGALTYKPKQNLSFLLRVDYDETYPPSLIDGQVRTLSARLGVEAKL